MKCPVSQQTSESGKCPISDEKADLPTEASETSCDKNS